MGLKQQIQPGVNFTPAYQMSGTPYCVTLTNVTSAATRVTFPYVTRWLMISARDGAAGAVRIGFSANGVNSNPDDNFFLLELTADMTDPTSASTRFNAMTPRLELRCKEIWVATDNATLNKVSIIAGLTGINEGAFPTLSGSDGFEGIG